VPFKGQVVEAVRIKRALPPIEKDLDDKIPI